MREDPNSRGSSSCRSKTSISLFFVFLLLAQTPEAQHSICGSIDIRNDARTVFNKENASDEFISRYMNCTILEGTFSLSMITNSSTREEDFVTFPNLVEITGYLLVFNVKSLTTLSRIFPNLRVIGGSQLIMNYALIIYQNPDLKDIGLPNLRVIRNGGVRISENPSLCFAMQIDWKRMTVGQIDDVLVSDGVTSGQKCTDQCDDPSNKCVRRQTGANGGQIISCWNATTCQETCAFDHAPNTTKEAGPGCLIGTSGKESMGCDPLCIGGCYEVNNPAECIACKGFLSGGKCVEKCPEGMYKYLSRCVTAEECIESPDIRIDDEWRNYKAVNGSCVYDCPAGYQEKSMKTGVNDADKRNICEQCGEYCPKKCKGRALDTIAMAKDLTGCNEIIGNLDIQLKDAARMNLLTEALKDIEIITGHLLIRFSPSLMSLAAFQNLKEIKGDELFQNQYALVIYENTNLNSLFSEETLKRLTINPNHKVQVQNNRMLCFKHVEKMMRYLRKGANNSVDPDDQSLFSNGDKAICEETTLTLDTSKVMAEGFVLRWTPFNVQDVDHRKFLGYQVFYKRVTSDDVSLVQIDQDRSMCNDDWTMHFEPYREKKEGKDEKKEENVTLTEDEERRIVYKGIKPSDSEIEQFEAGKKKQQEGWEEKNFINTVITHDGIVPNAYYAVYVQTKMVNHPGAKNARSNIHIVKTLFNNPTPPKITSVTTQGTNELVVEWEEPSRPNGDITHYILTWHAQYKDVSFEVAHACDSVSEKRRRYQEMATTTMHPMTTPAQQSFVSSITGMDSSRDVCEANGCCVCAPGQMSSTPSAFYDNEDLEAASDPDRTHDFENAVQNIVFVPSQDEGVSDRRSKRSIEAPREVEKEEEEERGNKTMGETKSEDEEGEEREEVIDGVRMEKDTGETDDEVAMPYPRGYLMMVKDAPVIPKTINVTAAKKNKYTIKGLTHATTYQIALVACQNVSVDPHFCSLKPVYKSQRTGEIKELDKVNESTIHAKVLNHTTSGSVFITFEAPDKPNGRIHGFTVTLYNVKNEQATPISHCVNSSIFGGGVIIRGLADGTYVPSVVTITSEGGSEPVRGPQFVIRSPSFFTFGRIVASIVLLLALFSVVALLIYYGTRKMVGKKIGEYVRQTISANPEYLSQFEMYKADEWELDRNSITIGEEIGRGTFGKVFRGWGNNVTSQCGTIFGECAIKTVSEDANPAERMHFLMEASVMKQFNSAFIIKLYGVVSDGQPVLVVMEMMAKGNLRDYLRSRRPDAEENTSGLPVPTDAEIMEWAAQIADGMSYLEYLKFCHRDLAARNCMIGADDCVKIGDFGMARDIYYHEYYKPTGKRMMPVRWMAPESLKDGKFSLKSDVWAYGIVLYEMMTLAQQPYQGLANDSVFNYIGVSRRTLERPVDCPDFWYDLMKMCWQYQPKDRPTFRQIVECLCLRASEDFRNRSWVINEAPELDDELKGDDRHEFIIDEDAQNMFCTDNRRRNEMDEFSDRGTELMNSEEEDSL